MSSWYHEMGSYQHQRMRKHPVQRKIPVVLIGGFLGSGKTTLANHVLAQPEEARTDVVVREYGLVSIDDKLMRVDPARVRTISGATMHMEEQTLIYMVLDRLHDERYGKFDKLLLETSGTENPEELLQLFFLWDMPYMYELVSFIAVVDSEYGMLNLNEYRAAREQLGYADVIVLNKTDCASPEEIDELEWRVRSINSAAGIVRTTYCQLSSHELGSRSLYEQLKVLRETDSREGRIYMDPISSIVIEEELPLDKAKVNKWIQSLFEGHGSKILRSKGFFNFIGEDYRYEFQAVRKSFHSYAHDLWPDGEPRKSVIVLIGEDLPSQRELKQSLEECAK